MPAIKIQRDFIWEKYGKKFALIDRMFCEIVGERCLLEQGLLVYHAKKVNKKEYFYIANKDRVFAHGDTAKKATQDLEFKIVSERLKSEPIKPDTIITPQYYRIVTGSCEMGVKEWMRQNNAPDEIRADELLKLLKKTNAYGLDRFVKLYTA